MTVTWRSLCAGPQYQSLQKLLEAFSSLSARAPNRYLRPSGRPDNPANVRRWWQYAGAVVRKQIRSQGFNWRQFEKVWLVIRKCWWFEALKGVLWPSAGYHKLRRHWSLTVFHSRLTIRDMASCNKSKVLKSIKYCRRSSCASLMFSSTSAACKMGRWEVMRRYRIWMRN